MDEFLIACEDVLAMWYADQHIPDADEALMHEVFVAAEIAGAILHLDAVNFLLEYAYGHYE